MEQARLEISSKPILVVIDYEAGNLRSIGKALDRAGAQPVFVRTPADVPPHDAIVLPGVGAFGSAMTRLREVGFPEWIRDRVEAGTPLLGVCLGIQLLFDRSEEGGDVEGLGVLPGDVRRLPPRVKVPHMGWNQLTLTQAVPALQDIPNGAFVYFVHSYIVQPRDRSIVAATTGYGEEWPSVVAQDRIVGLQFHPEKSAVVGQQILRNLVTWVAALRTTAHVAAPAEWRSSPRST